MPFHDPEALASLFAAIRDTLNETEDRRLITVPHNLNTPEFADVVVNALTDVTD